MEDGLICVHLRHPRIVLWESRYTETVSTNETSPQKSKAFTTGTENTEVKDESEG